MENKVMSNLHFIRRLLACPDNPVLEQKGSELMISKYLCRNALLLSLAIFALPLLSQADPVADRFAGYYSSRDSTWVFSMDSVFVQGFRAPELSPQSTVSIQEERIDAMGYRDLNEIVAGEIPGVFGNEKGVMGYGVASGSAGKLSIRGMGGDPTTNVLVAQNGKPEIMGLMGHPVPDAYSADFLRSVEVIKGPASLVYGTNAMGGVVNMKTKRIFREEFQTRLRIAAGSYDIRRLTFQHGGKLQDFDYYLLYGHRSTSGHRPHSAFRSDAYHLHLGYEPARNIYLSLQGKSVPFHMEDPGPVGGKTGEEYDIRRSDLTVSAQIGLDWVKLDYTFYHNQGGHEITDGFHSNDYMNGALLKHTLTPFPGNNTTLGLDYRSYGGTIHNVNLPPMWENPSGEDFVIEEKAFFALTQQRFGERFIPTLGVRYQRHSAFGGVIVPQVGLEYLWTDAITLHGSYGKGFRSPTIREMYLFPAPNPSLSPETSRTLQGGVKYRLSSTFRAELSGYFSRGSDLIETHGQFPNLTYRNTGEFTFSGIESSLKWVPVRGFHLDLNYSKFFARHEVANQPADHLRGSLALHRRLYTLRYTVEHVNGLQVPANGQYQELSPYTVSRLGVEVIPFDYGHLFLTIGNLFDASYRTMRGYPMPGRTFEGGVTVDL